MIGGIDNTLAMNSLKKSPSSVELKDKDDVLLKQQCDSFESIIVKMLLDESMKEKNELFPSEPGHEIYQSMYKEELSKNLTGSFGFSQLLFGYLKDQKNLRSPESFS